MIGPTPTPTATPQASLDGDDQRLADGVVARHPRALARAITLMESTRPDHQARASRILEALLPRAGNSVRLGITGSPGAGKSTFIEALGLHLTHLGRRVAVLAVDPSSSISGGSILGDKTRMERLSQDRNAFIRPSPSRGSLGGVAEKTREAMLLCEAAGFDVVLVETVGVGQSETTVAGMVDTFALIQLPNAGDDLQAIKRGIVELADVVAINKADLNPEAATLARRQFEMALRLLRSPSSGWRPRVVTLSAANGQGIDDFWDAVVQHRAALEQSGEFEAKRHRQAVDWMWSLIDSGLRARFRQDARVRRDLESISQAVGAGSISPSSAARRLLGHLDPDGRPNREAP